MVHIASTWFWPPESTGIIAASLEDASGPFASLVCGKLLTGMPYAELTCQQMVCCISLSIVTGAEMLPEWLLASISGVQLARERRATSDDLQNIKGTA
jgi:hypothetical protein